MKSRAHTFLLWISMVTFALAAGCGGDGPVFKVRFGFEGLSEAQYKRLARISVVYSYDDISVTSKSFLTPDGRDDKALISEEKKKDSKNGIFPEPQQGTLVDIDHNALTLHRYRESSGEPFTIKITSLDADDKPIGTISRDVSIPKGNDDGSKPFLVDIKFSGLATGKNGDCFVEADAIQLSIDPSSSFGVSAPNDQGGVLVVMSDNVDIKAPPTAGSITALALDAAGNPVGAPQPIWTSENSPAIPTVTRLGTGYVAAWQEHGVPGAGAHGVQVVVEALDSLGKPTFAYRTIKTNSPIEARPMIAAYGNTVALAWMDNDQVKLELMDGKTLKTTHGPITRPGAFATIAINPAQDNVLSMSWAQGSQVRALTLDLELTVLGEQAIYDSDRGIARQLRMTPTTHGFYTAWEDLLVDDSGEVVEDGRFDADWARGASTLTDAQLFGNASLIEQAETGSSNWPSPAWNGSSVATAYYQFRGFKSQIFFTRTSLEGERIDGVDFELTDVDGYAKYPALYFMDNDHVGDHYGLLWIDDHEGANHIYSRQVTCKAKDKLQAPIRKPPSKGPLKTQPAPQQISGEA